MIKTVGELCCGCGACSCICPKGCIRMGKNDEGFLYPTVQEDKCVHCGLCRKSCPVLRESRAAEGGEADQIPKAWGGTATDDRIVSLSSSGGIFTLLAEAVLKNNGIVYGAAFTDDNKSVEHIRVEDSEGVARLRGAKYLQSDTAGSYVKVKEDLLNGTTVLFSGTPCQIAGLKGYLGQDYDNLITVDIICHGVPSPLVWEEYLQHITGGKTVRKVSFRAKDNGWKNNNVKVEYEGGVYQQTNTEDTYMKYFLKNYCLRESCYKCTVKEKGYLSDITIGDFWGVEKAAPQLDNDRGVSLVLLRTGKGERLIQQIWEQVDGQQVDYNSATVNNPCVYCSVARPAERDRFFDDLRSKSWTAVKKKYVGEKISERIKNILSRTIAWKILRKGLVIVGLRK